MLITSKNLRKEELIMSFQQIVQNAYKALAESKFGMNSPANNASTATAYTQKTK